MMGKKEEPEELIPDSDDLPNIEKLKEEPTVKKPTYTQSRGKSKRV